jgi:hypothetical protein
MGPHDTRAHAYRCFLPYFFKKIDVSCRTVLRRIIYYTATIGIAFASSSHGQKRVCCEPATGEAPRAIGDRPNVTPSSRAGAATRQAATRVSSTTRQLVCLPSSRLPQGRRQRGGGGGSSPPTACVIKEFFFSFL